MATPITPCRAGEVLKTDLFVAADRTQINGDVDGDLIVFSHSVTVNGHVTGDILAFAAELTVNGPVDGNVRAFAQTVIINSNVGKNVMVFGGEMNLRDTANVGGTITLFTGDTALSGHVAGDLLGFGGNFDINGVLGHDAKVHADTLSIGANAEIKGQTKFEGSREAEVSSSAKLGSPVQFTMKKRSHETDYTSARFYWHQTLLWGASFVFGLVVLLLAPGFFFDAERACKKAAQSIGLGLLFFFATPIVAIIVCITIVGLGVGISTLLLLDYRHLCGAGIRGFVVGRKDTRRRHRSRSRARKTCARSFDTAGCAYAAAYRRLDHIFRRDPVGNWRYGAGAVSIYASSVGTSGLNVKVRFADCGLLRCPNSFSNRLRQIAIARNLSSVQFVPLC